MNDTHRATPPPPPHDPLSPRTDDRDTQDPLATMPPHPHVPPPPPGARAVKPGAGADAPPTHGQVALLMLFGSVGAVLTAIGFAVGSASGVRLVGLFLCCHAVIVAASWLPAGVLSQRLDDWLDSWVADVGGGFYGLMALAMFVGLEVGSTFEDVFEFDFSIGAIGGAVLPWIIGFSIESFMNGLQAAIWPGVLFAQLGTFGAAMTAGVCWGLFWVGSRAFPQPAFVREPKRKKKKNKRRNGSAGDDASP